MKERFLHTFWIYRVLQNTSFYAQTYTAFSLMPILQKEKSSYIFVVERTVSNLSDNITTQFAKLNIKENINLALIKVRHNYVL